MSNHPYLCIGKDLELEWVMDDKADNFCVHRLNPILKVDLELDTSETVKNFIRYTRNYYAFYTNLRNTYECGPNGKNKINIDSDITPTYDRGWYMGYADGNISMVNRQNNLLNKKFPFEEEILDIQLIKYTHNIILNTNNGVHLYETNYENLIKIKTLCATFETMCICDDGAVFAAAHEGGKITIMWTCSWKTHHTLRSPSILDMEVSSKFLVAITKNTKHIYLWDLVSGEVIATMNSTWNHPNYIFINENINTLGITTIDNTKSLISTYEISEKPKHKTWKYFDISPKIKLITVCKIPYKISKSIHWNTNILMNADGYFMKFKYSLTSRTFEWPMDIIGWIKEPRKELYLEPLCNTTGDIPDIIKYTIIYYMNEIVENLLETVIEGEIFNKWSLNRLLKDEKILQSFNTAYDFAIIKLYSERLFNDRIITTNIILYAKTMNLDMENLVNILPLPDTLSDFIFWTVLFKNNTKYEKLISKRENFCKHLLEKLIDSNSEKIRISIRELLYDMNYHLTDWENIINYNCVFDFIKPKMIKKTCEMGFTSNWIEAFKRAKETVIITNNIRNCWKELTEWVLSIEQLKLYNYPNPNDGVWTNKHVDEITKDSWVLINNKITPFELPDGNYNGPEEIKCWTLHREGHSNSIERALAILDKETWCINNPWKLWNKNNQIEAGFQIKCKSYGQATVMNWPVCTLKSGVLANLKDINEDIYYRLPSVEYDISPQLRLKAENYIRELILEQDLPYIPEHYKPEIFSMLSPYTVSNIISHEMIADITCITISKKNIWLGTYSGNIIIINIDNLFDSVKTMNEISSYHTEIINDLHARYGYVVSCSNDSVVQVWTDDTFKIISYHTAKWSSIKQSKLVSAQDVWFLVGDGSVWNWNFKTDMIPQRVSMNSNGLIVNWELSIYGKYCLINADKIKLIYTEYPYHIMESTRKIVTSICMLTQNSYLIGNKEGEVILYSMENNKRMEDKIWSENEEAVSCLYKIPECVNWDIIIGCESGLFVLKSLDEDFTLFEWRASNSIVSVCYKTPNIIILTADYSLYTMTYRDNQVETSSKCLCILSNNTSWKKFIRRPNKINFIQEIILHGVQHKKCLDDFYEVIDLCLKENDNCKEWCKKEILNVLNICVLEGKIKYQKLIDRLFCFSGKRFKCTLCLGTSSSPKRFPISAINTCMHRFHTKCIEEHCKKTREWDNECQQNWALRCILKCPLCSEPFKKSNIVEDTFTTNICKYISDEDI